MSFLNVHLPGPGTHLVHYINVTLFEIISKLKFAFPQSNFCFYFTKWVAQNCQEHVEEDKEDEENKTEKVYWPKELVSLGNVKKVEVAQDCPDQSEGGVVHAAVIGHLGAKHEVTQLDESEEDDEEHEHEPTEVSRAAAKSSGKLSHGRVEGDVLEKLAPGEEHGDGCDAVKEVSPEGESGEVYEWCWVDVDILERWLNDKESKESMAKKKETQKDDYIIQVVIESIKVLLLQLPQLKNFLNAIEEKKSNENKFSGHDKVIIDAAIPDQFHPGVKSCGKDPSCSWELENQLDNSEHVHVSVVHCEVDEDDPGAHL